MHVQLTSIFAIMLLFSFNMIPPKADASDYLGDQVDQERQPHLSNAQNFRNTSNELPWDVGLKTLVIIGAKNTLQATGLSTCISGYEPLPSPRIKRLQQSGRPLGMISRGAYWLEDRLGYSLSICNYAGRWLFQRTVDLPEVHQLLLRGWIKKYNKEVDTILRNAGQASH